MSKYFEKQPDEIYSFSVDFGDVLDTDETISSKSAIAIDLSDNTIVTSTVIESSAIDGDSVTVKVKDGLDGESFKITVKATTSLLNTFEEDIIMNIIEE